MDSFASCVFSRRDINRGEVEQIGIGIVTVDFKHFGNKAATGTSFDLNDHVEGVADIGFNRSKAKVNPETTIATSDSPRAMVLVKACCRTLTAFSQGEFVCAKAGAASSKPKIRLR